MRFFQSIHLESPFFFAILVTAGLLIRRACCHEPLLGPFDILVPGYLLAKKLAKKAGEESSGSSGQKKNPAQYHSGLGFVSFGRSTTSLSVLANLMGNAEIETDYSVRKGWTCLIVDRNGGLALINYRVIYILDSRSIERALVLICWDDSAYDARS